MSDQGATPPPYPEGNQPPPSYPQGAGYPPPPAAAPYGQPGYPPPYGHPGSPMGMARPGTVTAGCVMAWVGGAFGAIVGLVLLVADTDSIGDVAGLSVDEGALRLTGGILLLMSLAAVVLAVFAFRRSKGAAIALVCLAGLTIVSYGLGLVLGGGGSPVGMLFCVASAALVYGSKPSKAWFSGA